MGSNPIGGTGRRWAAGSGPTRPTGHTGNARYRGIGAWVSQWGSRAFAAAGAGAGSARSYRSDRVCRGSARHASPDTVHDTVGPVHLRLTLPARHPEPPPVVDADPVPDAAGGPAGDGEPDGALDRVGDDRMMVDAEPFFVKRARGDEEHRESCRQDAEEGRVPDLRLGQDRNDGAGDTEQEPDPGAAADAFASQPRCQQRDQNRMQGEDNPQCSSRDPDPDGEVRRPEIEPLNEQPDDDQMAPGCFPVRHGRPQDDHGGDEHRQHDGAL